ncbi:MAG: ribosomal protein methylthiotransferase, partial [Campylobacterota bacterium]|nr:ribosomal protein methylthiotransferase [Campylobacterota bacterium]
EILGKIASKCMEKSLKNEIDKEVQIVIDGESEEHEYLLSARELFWAPEIDGEIYVNDQTNEAELEFGKAYRAKITDILGNILTATVDNA